MQRKERFAAVSYEHLFTKEEGRFFGDSGNDITAYDNIDAEECARRCLQGHGSYDGVNPICLSFNHRPAGSPEGGSARCWLRSSDKDTAASPGPEWDRWPYRNYYQRKQILAPQDCTDMFTLGIENSRVYTVGHPQPFQAYCNMDTDGGGWTVIQRRQDGSVPFDKIWTEYEQGFGNTSGEYWLGLGNIHSLTTQKPNELYVYLEDWETNSRFARYSEFSVGDASSKYTATIGGYSGDATDSLDPSTTRHGINNRQFSTTDQDNDGVSTDCAGEYGQGGWWYTRSCGYAMLNGQYLTGCSVPAPASCSHADGIVWYTWLGYGYSLKKSVMMIRPADFPVSSFKPCQNGGTLTSGPEDSGLYICACADGWHGAFCDQECADGYYGYECRESCGNCVTGTVCDKTNGVCPCEVPWVGNTCKMIPATVSDHPESLTVVVDNKATFNCTGRGVPAPTVTWHHDAEVITPGAGISIDVTDGGLVGEQGVTHSTLSMTSARRQDNGEYVCITSNVAGSDTSQAAAATLVVQGAETMNVL
ncbi:PREDICTED: uncharacterized protein LOC109475336 [Branchiostoma belcheri]|uniref:Uncharacterized protein LOC109475336 n=1 Tax=Branchiostoma belcheri TaxID=7741 RepID=A0A6P4ZC75_BRABE|nr:PREDICTED: uncharacterized protein LOC109475336 [Branchiostoma belcheri]